jgi:hypothetical protein
MSSDEIAAKRGKLAELDAELTRLRTRYDLLLSGFRFDEAKALIAEIETLEHERGRLAAILPPPEPGPSAPYAVTRRRGVSATNRSARIRRRWR